MAKKVAVKKEKMTVKAPKAKAAKKAKASKKMAC
jgi:hypothetical protein